MSETRYILVDPVTKDRLPYPNEFRSATAASLFALLHDIRAEIATVVSYDPNQRELNLIGCF